MKSNPSSRRGEIGEDAAAQGNPVGELRHADRVPEGDQRVLARPRFGPSSSSATGIAVEKPASPILAFGLTDPRASEPGGELVAQAAGELLATIDGGGGSPVPETGYVASRSSERWQRSNPARNRPPRRPSGAVGGGGGSSVVTLLRG